MKRFLPTVLVALTLLLLSGCTSVKQYVSMYQILHEPAPEPIWRNPLPNTPEVTASGQALFLQHCARCHGAEGKGDGPKSWHLDPKPADLSKKKIQESQIYKFITDGKAQTGMPAFGGSLSIEERASVVRFIQKLAVVAPDPRSTARQSPR